MTDRRCLAAFVLLLIALSADAADPPPPAWNPVAFNALDPAARVTFARDALAWRDARLQNFAYELAQIAQNVDAKTHEVKQRFGDELHFEVRRLGAMYLITGIADSGIVGDVPRRFWSRWDGVVYRSFVEAGNLNEASGSIRPE